ncbi:MAG: DoxX family membrane protein [Ignavibacteriaceae bacterium]|nr:DoxX family membrane protein [Ignavibacteriaceae bacterium]
MIKQIFGNKYLLLLLRLFLGFVFIYAAVSKISDPLSFSKAIYNYKLMPDVFINFLALSISWVELVAGVLLLFGVSVKENSVILSGLLLVFIIAIGISVARGLNIDCGCFGTAGGTKVGIQKILENIGLLLVGLLLIKFDSKFLSLSCKE